MKTKLKRHSRSVLSVLLTICMLVSCMTVGLIATDAAKVTNDEAVGWNGTTDKFNVGIGGTWTLISLSSDGKATFTVPNDNTEVQFEFNFNGTLYRYESSQQTISKDNLLNTNKRVAKSGSGTSPYIVTNAYAGTYTVELLSTVSNGAVDFCITGTRSGQETTASQGTTAPTEATVPTDSWYLYGGDEKVNGGFGPWSDWGEDVSRLTAMTYDTSRSCFTVDFTINQTATKNWFRVLKNNTTHYDSGANDVALATDGTKSSMRENNTAKAFSLNNFSAGTEVVICVDSVSKEVWVEEKNPSYYTVSFSSDSHGTAKAKIGNTYIESGAKVRNNTSVTFEATAKDTDHYNFKQWSGSFSDSNAPVTKTITADTTVKANFKIYDGSELDKYYFNYKEVDNENDRFQNPNTWSNNPVKVQVKNNHIYGYINNVQTNKVYLYSLLKTNNKWDTWYRDGSNTHPATITTTKFPQSLTLYQDANYDESGYKYYGAAKVTDSSVKGLIIDLGEYKGEDAFNVVYDVIPVYDTVNAITVYAKNGSYRGSNTYDYFSDIADTVITSTTSVTNIKQQTKFQTGKTSIGSTVTVQTTINSAYRSKYYIVGFCVNGITPKVFTPNEVTNGVYNLEYTIPAGFNENYLEITPIYFLKDTTNTVMFYIENYDEAFMDTGWGNTLSVYPYYTTASNGDVNRGDNAFGGYPGQPVVNYGGRRYVQVPTKYNIFRADNLTVQNGTNSTYSIGTEATIKGVTLSNDYFDIVHRDYANEVATHLQTYDFDDFVKIYSETSAGREPNKETFPIRNKIADQITFAFKHRTANDNNPIPSTFNTSDYTNGWELYTDYHDRPVDLFGKILTNSEQHESKLYVVSDGYNPTFAGHYATTWTIYAPNSSGTGYEKVGTLPPSILMINGTDHFSEYKNSPNINNNITIATHASYATLYNNLKNNWAGHPFEITYEKAILNGTAYDKQVTDVSNSSYATWLKTADISNRGDGRWFYSYMGDAIKANISIQFKDTGDTEFRDDDKLVTGDYSKVNKGSHTGATAYFTNEDHVGDIEYNTQASADGKFTFAATVPDGYIFSGWWFERDNICTEVNSKLEAEKYIAESAMTSNSRFIARFTQAPSGKLKIKHTLDPNTKGTGTTYVSVTMTDKNGTTTTLATDSENGYEIASENLVYGSGKTFTVTLKTDYTGQENYQEFNAFTQDANDKKKYTLPSPGGDAAVKTTSFTFSVDDLFKNEGGTLSQVVSALNFFSSFNLIDYYYSFTYWFDPYLKDLYGDQGYTVSGKFTDDDLKNNMSFDSSGNLRFAVKTVEGQEQVDQDKVTTLLNKFAPYEDNFMNLVQWNTIIDSGVTARNYNPETKIFSARISSTAVTHNIQKVIFKFPYDYTDNYSSKYAPVVTDGKIIKKDSKAINNPQDCKYSEVFSLNEYKTANYTDDSKAPEYLSAPEKIYNETSGKYEYFCYWSVKTLDDDSKRSSTEYTRCYFKEFNFAVFQSIVVEPVYRELRDNETSIDLVNESKNYALGATITFIENSRNQYNNGNCGVKDGGANMPSNRRESGDRIYSDFLLSFNVNNHMQLNTYDANTYKYGIVIETVGALERDENGDFFSEKDSVYQGRYGATISDIESKEDRASGTKKTEIENFIKGNSSTSGSYIKSQEFDNKDLDNKNRVRFYYSLPNRRHGTLEDLPRRYQVYRAYSYLKDSSNNVVMLSEQPVYFTIFDIGSIESYSDAQNGGYVS